MIYTHKNILHLLIPSRDGKAMIQTYNYIMGVSQILRRTVAIHVGLGGNICTSRWNTIVEASEMHGSKDVFGLFCDDDLLVGRLVKEESLARYILYAENELYDKYQGSGVFGCVANYKRADSNNVMCRVKNRDMSDEGYHDKANFMALTDSDLEEKEDLSYVDYSAIGFSYIHLPVGYKWWMQYDEGEDQKFYRDTRPKLYYMKDINLFHLKGELV